MRSNRVSLICKVENTLNQHSYTKILDKIMFPFIEKIENDKKKIFFVGLNLHIFVFSFILVLL